MCLREPRASNGQSMDPTPDALVVAPTVEIATPSAAECWSRKELPAEN
jgi:hypothetical protein